MRHLVVGFLGLLGILVTQAVAGELRVLELRDGSVITGEILSLKNGVYTLESDSLGTINIEASTIRAIRAHPSPQGAPPQANPQPQATDPPIGNLLQTMMGNPEIMELMSSLLQQADMQAVLSDPAILEAVRTNNFNALLANPKFMQLLNNPTVQDIGKKTNAGR